MFVMRTSRFPLVSQNVLTVESTVAFGYARTLATVDAHEKTGQSGLCLSLDFVRCCVMVSIFSPFFWLTKVMETQSAVVSVDRGL